MFDDINFFKSTALMFFLLNPFFMSIYLLEFYHSLHRKMFISVLLSGACIATSVFVLFAWAGEQVFQDILQARFCSFLVFGGIVFFIIGVKCVFQGESALVSWRGSPDQMAGTIAMPYMIGPGTIGASVMTGSRLSTIPAAVSIVIAVILACATIILLKFLFDFVKQHNERLISRYVAIMGRVMAFVIGTFSIEMIFQGIEQWLRLNQSQ